MPNKSARSGAGGDDYVRDRREAYEKFFQMARHRFHKIIYVKTPSPDFWKIRDSKSLSCFGPMAEYAENMADRYGALTIDGEIFFSRLVLMSTASLAF